MADANGDELSDFIYISGTSIRVILSYSSGARPDANWGTFATRTWNNVSQWIGDVNGDGLADLVYATAGFEGKSYYAMTSQPDFPDLITSVENGLGNTNTIKYRPLSDKEIYTASLTNPTYPVAAATGFLYRPTTRAFLGDIIGGSEYVVSQYEVQSSVNFNGAPYAYRYTYHYAGAQFDHDSRGWLGFRTTSTTDHQLSTVKSNYYYQDFPKTGCVEATEVRCAAGNKGGHPAGTLLGSIQSMYVSESSQEHSEVFRVFKRRMHQFFYDYGVYKFSIGKEFAYDEYNNLTNQNYLGYVSEKFADLDPADNVYTTSSYFNDPKHWLLGYKTEIKVTTDAAGGHVLQKQEMGYDFPADISSASAKNAFPGSMNLVSQRTWVDDNNSGNTDFWLRKSMVYDAYGNQTSITGAANNTTTTKFDQYHTFPVSKTFPANEQGGGSRSISPMIPNSVCKRHAPMAMDTSFLTSWTHSAESRRIKDRHLLR